MWFFHYYSLKLLHKNYTLFSLKPPSSNLTYVYLLRVVSLHLHMLPQYYQSHLHLASLFDSHLCHLPPILPQVPYIPQLDYHLWHNVSFGMVSNYLEVYFIHHLTWVSWRSWALRGNTLVHCLSSHCQTFWDAFPSLHDTWFFNDALYCASPHHSCCLDLQVFLPHFFGVFIN